MINEKNETIDGVNSNGISFNVLVGAQDLLSQTYNTSKSIRGRVR